MTLLRLRGRVGFVLCDPSFVCGLGSTESKFNLEVGEQEIDI